MSCTLTSLTRRTALGLATLSLAALALSAVHPAAAAAFGTTITANGATFTPTSGTGDISQLDFSAGLNDSQDYTDSATPGQTFTTGSNSLGYLLNNLTLKGSGNAGNGYQTGNFVVDISSVGGSTPTTLTSLGKFTASAAPLLGHESDFFTIDLSAANLTLASGTQYAYDIYGTAGFFGLSRAGEVYPGGSAFKGDQGSKNSPTSFTSYIPSYDRTFNVGLTANLPSSAPEASQTLVMGMMTLGLGGLLAVARRRRALS